MEVVILSKAKDLIKSISHKSFTEFILSQRSRPFVSLRVTGRRVLDDK